MADATATALPNGPRTVIQADALTWMKENAAPEKSSVVTSLPDVSELSQLNFDEWRAWFVNAAREVIRWVAPGGVAIFYQSDIRIGAAWVDKGYLVMRAAEEERATIAWHKVVCRKPAGTIGLGRPSYSHMICVSRETREVPKKPGPDVLPDAGFMPWSRAMGVTACRVACQFIRDETDTTVIVDPFCGRGTLLAVANAMGFAAIGVDLGAARCKAARALVVGDPDEKAPASAREAFELGARLFDAGAFWEAHEAWEARWRTERDDAARRTLQGLIQIAAAFHKAVVMDSPEAALRLFARGISKLDAPPEDFELGVFRSRVEACAAALSDAKLDRANFPRLLPT